MSTFTFCEPCTHFGHAEGPDVTPLAPYIRRAEQIHFAELAPSSPVFPDLDIPPMLRRGRRNRILVLAGCFDPPHFGHLELLAHVFLRTDSVTVAAMVVPANEEVCKKKSAIVKGAQFVLTKEYRKGLWQGEVLSRMVWMYMGSVFEFSNFQATVVRLAAEDGYDVSFTGLAGSDHWRLDREMTNDLWGTGDLITSDITRASVLMNAERTDPVQLQGGEPWEEVITAESKGKPGSKFCWPCRKFQLLCPELAGMSVTAGTGEISSICVDILRRCHDKDRAMWTCENNNYTIWFLSSGRKYPIDKRLSTVSSTAIRRLLDETPPDGCLDAIKHLALSPQELLDILDIECHPVEAGVEEEAEVQDAARKFVKRVKFFLWLTKRILGESV